MSILKVDYGEVSGAKTLKQEMCSSREAKGSGSSTGIKFPSTAGASLDHKPSGQFILMTSTNTFFVYNPSASNPNHGILEAYTGNARATASDREVDVTFGDDYIEIGAFAWGSSVTYWDLIYYYEA